MEEMDIEGDNGGDINWETLEDIEPSSSDDEDTRTPDNLVR